MYLHLGYNGSNLSHLSRWKPVKVTTSETDVKQPTINKKKGNEQNQVRNFFLQIIGKDMFFSELEYFVLRLSI